MVLILLCICGLAAGLGIAWGLLSLYLWLMDRAMGNRK